MNINQTTAMRRFGATVLIGSLYLAASVGVRADSGSQPIEHGAPYRAIDRALLLAAESQDSDGQACSVSCDDVKSACNERCVGVTAGSCFARCANEQKACLRDCGGEEES